MPGMPGGGSPCHLPRIRHGGGGGFGQGLALVALMLPPGVHAPAAATAVESPALSTAVGFRS